MDVFILEDYDSEVYGVYYSEKDAMDAARKQMKAEGVDDANDMDIALSDWVVVGTTLKGNKKGAL
jgi:hypothetical protein